MKSSPRLFRSAALLGSAAFLSLAGSLAAENFHPISGITSSNSTELAGYVLGNLFQGAGVGFDAAEPHAQLGGGGPATSWVTINPNGAGDYYANGIPAPILVIDLGQDRVLSEISTWGYSDGNTNGGKDFTLRFATEAEGNTGFGSSIAYAPSFEAGFNYAPRSSHPFSEIVIARYVEMTITDNWRGFQGGTPGGDRVGLGEIAFKALPDGDPLIVLPAALMMDSNGSPVEFTIPVSNGGATQNLTISAVTPGGANDANLGTPVFPASLAPAEGGEIVVTLDPTGLSGSFTASLTVESNDLSNPSAVVELTGFIRDPGISAPASFASPLYPPASGPQTILIPIENTGATEDLEITDVSILAQSGTHFGVGMAPAPIAGLSTGSVPISFDPMGLDGLFRATIQITSNDLVTPTIIVELIAQVEIAEPLVAWWSLDVDGTDDSGNGHDGTIVGSLPSCPGASASTGGALDFDGATAHIDVPFNASLNPAESFTVTLWARPDATGGGLYRSPITSRDDFQGGTRTHGYILYNNSVGFWDFWTGDGDPGWDAVTGPAVIVNEWIHVALVYDAVTNTKILYLNGAEAMRMTLPTRLYSPNGTDESEMLHLGGGGDSGMEFLFDGCLDDIAVFRDALAEEEIIAIREAGVGEFTNPSVPFNIVRFTRLASAVELEFESEVNVVYDIQRSLDLITWETLPLAAIGETGTTVYTDTAPPADEPQVYYRVEDTGQID